MSRLCIVLYFTQRMGTAALDSHQGPRDNPEEQRTSEQPLGDRRKPAPLSQGTHRLFLSSHDARKCDSHGLSELCPLLSVRTGQNLDLSTRIVR